MFEAFRLKGPLGRDMSMDLDDALATKKALRSLGHFRTPSYGLTEYPDDALIDGLKSFQRANGLRVDGVMRPDGPTHRKLNLALTQPRSEPAAPSGRAPTERPSAPTRRRPPLTLKQPVKASASVDLDDALKVKTALAGLGLLRTPKDGLSPYPDRALFDAVEAFQRQAGLRVDGEMAPDGPTVKKLNAALDALAQAGGSRGPGNPDGRIELAMTRRPGAPGQILEGEGYHGPTRSWGNAATGLLGLGALFEMQRRMAGHEGDVVPAPDPSVPSPRTRIADPLPPVPPSEPPDDEDELPDRTELPPAGPMPSTEGRPVVDDELRTMIGGYPDQSDDELMQMLILESRGSPEVQENNRFIVKVMDDCLDWLGLKWEHEYGSYTREGDYRAERLLKAINHIKKGARPDMIWEITDDSGKPYFADIQTYTTWKDGRTPVADESRAMDRIRALRHEYGQRGSVGGFPKSGGRDLEEWKREMLEAVWDYCIETYGPLSKKMKDPDSLMRASRKKGVRVLPK